MPWAEIWKRLSDRATDLRDFSRAFFSFGTETMVAISGSGGWKRGLELAGLFICVALGIFAVSAFVLREDATPPLFVLGSVVLQRVAISLIVTCPYILLYFWLQRQRIPFALNILAFQQIPAILIISIAGAVATLPQPGRTDFANLEKGYGQGTVAYDFTCGIMEDTAHIAALTRAIDEAADAAQAKEDAARAGTGTIEGYFAQSRQLSRVMGENLKRQADLLVGFEKIFDEYHRTYPNLRIAEAILEYGFAFLGLFLIINLYKGLSLGVRGDGGISITRILFAAATVAAGLIGYALHNLASYPEPREFAMSELRPDGTSRPLEERVRALREFKADRERREGRIRALFEEHKTKCPGANNHGLW